MEAHGSLHRMWSRELQLMEEMEDSTSPVSGSFYLLPLNLPLRSMEVHLLPSTSNVLPWKFLEASMEVNLLLFTSMDASMEDSMETSMEVREFRSLPRSFHGSWCKFPWK